MCFISELNNFTFGGLIAVLNMINLFLGPGIEPGKQDRPAGQLYHTAELRKTTIERCVDAYSEAVVKVSSPAGMGSGFFINEDGYLITNYTS